MAKEIQEYLGFGWYYEHGFFRTVLFNRRADVLRLVQLFKPRTVLKQSTLGLLERALEVLKFHQHFTRAGLLALLDIREQLTKELMPSRSSYARRINRIDELRYQIMKMTEKYLHEEDTSFGARLRKGRLLKGWTQKELAEHMDMPKVMIWKYENGSCTLSRARYLRLTQELNL